MRNFTIRIAGNDRALVLSGFFDRSQRSRVGFRSTRKCDGAFPQSTNRLGMNGNPRRLHGHRGLMHGISEFQLGSHAFARKGLLVADSRAEYAIGILGLEPNAEIIEAGAGIVCLGRSQVECELSVLRNCR